MSTKSLALEFLPLMNSAYDSKYPIPDGWAKIAGPIIADPAVTQRMLSISARVHVPMLQDLLKPDVNPFGDILWHKVTNRVVAQTRGTETEPEWIGDAFAFKAAPRGAPDGVRVHEGIWIMHQIIDASMAAAVTAARSLVSDNAQWYFQGHSLGGPLSEQSIALYGRPHRDISVTWEAPRYYNPEGATWFDSQFPGSIRIANLFDGVPHLPPESFGFKHVAQLTEVHGGWKWNDARVAHNLVTGVLPGLQGLTA